MSQPNPPQPSWLLIISSVLVIAGCVLVTSAAVMSLYMTDIFFKLLTRPVAIPPAALGIVQYFGTFRRHAGAAKIAAVCLYVAGALCCVGTITNGGEHLLESKWMPGVRAMLLILTFLLISGMTIYSARMNERWSVLLTEYYTDHSSASDSKRFTLRELLGAMTILAVIIGLSGYWQREDLPPHALHTSRDDVAFSLPQNATDIAYCQGPDGIAYEFTTDEASFVDWVESDIVTPDVRLSGYPPLQPITQPSWILRYHHFSPYLDGPSDEIVNGLEYFWYENPTVKAIYDRDTGRAYYSSGHPPRFL